MKTKLFLFAISIAVLFFACKGDKGDTGPQGATGTQGSTNIISEIINVTAWLNPSPGIYTASITDSAITQSIVDNGAVLVYISNGSGSWLALPYTINLTGGATQSYLFAYSLNGINFIYERENLTPGNPGIQTFKVIIMAGSIVRDNPFVDYNNYSEVKATFNLQD